MGVRRDKAAFFSGCTPHPATAPAGSNRSSHGGNQNGWSLRCSRSHIGDGASVRAATRVNAEQSPKRTMCRPTRQRYRGRLIRLGEMSDDDAQPLHRGSGGSTYTRKARATREAPQRGQVSDDRTNRTPVRDRPALWGGGEVRSTAETG